MTYASKIAEFLSLPLCGPDLLVKEAHSIENIQPHSVFFLKTTRPEIIAILNFAPVFVIAGKDVEGLRASHVRSDNPRLDFARVVQQFFIQEPIRRFEHQFHPTAVVPDRMKLGEHVSIGAYSVIGENVEIGDNTKIGHHVVIDNAIIGSNCVIKSHAIIGEKGFGFEFDDEHNPIAIPHIGKVIIGDNVEIGAATVICRATLEETRIGDNVKIDDHVFIAHNVRIGANSLIIAGAEISGSAIIGRDVWIAPMVSVRNGIKIGDKAFVGLGAVVVKDVPNKTVVMGNPAKSREQFIQQ